MVRVSRHSQHQDVGQHSPDLNVAQDGWNLCPNGAGFASHVGGCRSGSGREQSWSPYVDPYISDITLVAKVMSGDGGFGVGHCIYAKPLPRFDVSGTSGLHHIYTGGRDISPRRRGNCSFPALCVGPEETWSGK